MSGSSADLSRILGRLADNRNPRSVASRLRARRVELLRALLADLPRPLRILDLGGTEVFWRALGADDDDMRIVLLNRTLPTMTNSRFQGLVGDARRLDAFRDEEFDVVFSNSVIEHVGDWHDQAAMASEVRRVGRAYFVQTPNWWFPIEPHFLVPGFQFLPVAVQVALIRRFDLGWYTKIPDPGSAHAHVLSHRLLSASQMRRLFPDARLLRERIVGLTKSLIAWRPPSSC